MKQKLLLGLVLALVAIQFIRPQKNLSAVTPGPDDLVTKFAPPPEVRSLLAVACYDCHSNRTRYPWYAEVQPVGWWLANHIDEGKDHLNFSEFGTLSAKTQGKKFGRIADELTDGTMPLASYTWVHRDAKLTATQIQTLTDWAEAQQDKVESNP